MVFNLFKAFGGSSQNKKWKSDVSAGVVKASTKNMILRDWQNIQILLSGKQPSQLRQALITADKALDNALRDVVPGETMGERLKNAKDQFEYKVYDNIWKAHKMRNAVVHESGYEPPYHMVEQAINNLKAGLNVLGVNV